MSEITSSASEASDKNSSEDILKEIRESTYNVDDVGLIDEDGDNEDNSYYDGRLLINQNYEDPKDEDKFIDTSKGEIVIDKTKLSPFDIIKAVAKQNGIEIRNPRLGCKHCYGRGFIGRDHKTEQPIPCNCIYPIKTQSQKIAENVLDKNNNILLTKKQIKKLKRLIKTERKLIKLQKIKEEERLKKLEN